ncbi:uncharacterized protein LOC143463447 [Clavelina lepadiformis]|uniref:uncharacterized protein LOC143463447 n=1 Tax=Clavelina lepadiformis TaxID=159417 RepID=UPI0040415FE6
MTLNFLTVFILLLTYSNLNKMDDRGNASYKVSVTGLPEEYGLSRIKDLIHEHLETEDAISDLDFVEKIDGSKNCRVSLVTLKKEEYQQKLVAMAVIEATFRKTQFKLNITKARPRVKSTPVLTSAVPVGVVPTQSEKQSLPRDPRQRKLYCCHIPSYMFSYDGLRTHFNRFGNIIKIFIPNNPQRRFAIIEFETPKSALEAFENGRKTGYLNLTIEWEKKEAEMLRSGKLPEVTSPSRNTQQQPSYFNRPFERDSISERKPKDTKRSDEEFPNNNNFTQNNRLPGQIQPLQTVTWQDLLKTDEDFFSGLQNRCVLVKDVSRKTSSNALKSYFEDPSKSGGGSIEKMPRCLPDGILITFSKAETAKNVVEFGKHRLDSADLLVYSKPVPAVYNDRFLVEGHFEDEGTVKDIVECCLASDDFSVKKMDDSSGRYVVLMTRDRTNIEKVMTDVRNIALEDLAPKVDHLCTTDCIKVSNLGKDVKNNKIKLTFMKKDLTDTGIVTLIQRDIGNDVAYVYFADYHDAEKVAEISRTKKIEIANQTVDVSLCYHNPCLNKDKKEKEDAKQSRSQTSSRKSRESLCAFQYSPEVEKEVIEFVKKSSTHLISLSKEFQGLSSVKIEAKRSSGRQPSNFVVRFEPLPKNKMKEGQTNQSDFESECSSRIMNFLRKFNSRAGHFGSKGLDKLRKSNLWTSNDCDIIKIEIDRIADVSVLARWNHPKDGDFIIAGLENEVSQAFKWLQSKMEKENKTEMSEFVKEWQLEFLKDCGILDEIRSKFKNTTISVNDEDCKVTFSGSKVDVENSRTDILKQLRKIESSRLTFLEDDKLDFLTRVLKQTGQKPEIDVAQMIKSRFRQVKLKCVLQCSSELKLKYILERDLERANAILNEIVQRRSIPVKAGLSELLDAEEWKKFEESLCSSGALAVNVNRQNSTIVLIGVAKCLEEGEFRLNEYVKENAVGSKVIEMPYPVARFLSEYPNEVGLDEKLKNVEWYPTSEGSGGIMVQGKADNVKSAFVNLKKLIPSIKIDPHDVSEPGMPGYFRGDIGGQFLKTTQAITKCIILVDTDKDPKWKKATPASKILAIGTTSLLSAKISHTKVTVNVIKNDITEHATDAIVNASNTELELRSAGVSGSISKKGGLAIQQEMSIQRRRVGGELAAGLAVTTSAGNLPCKKIIHAVGPMWHSQADSWSRQSLKDAVKSSLSEADSFNLRSIAIPAISCGVFGGKPEVCTKLIVQALVEYFDAKSTSSSIRQVDLIEMSQDKILELFKKQVASVILNEGKVDEDEDDRKKHSNWMSRAGEMLNSVIMGSDKTSSSTTKSSASSHQARSYHPLNVQIKQGNILTSDCEVIVNLTGSDFNLTGGQLSKQMIAKAGPGIVQECNNKPRYSSAQYRVTSGGGLNCKNVLHLVSPKDAKYVSKSLKTAFEVVEKKLQLSSVAIPAIGTGNLGLKPVDVAKATCESLDAFAKTKPFYLKRVDVVIFQSTMLQDFQNIIHGSRSYLSASSRVDDETGFADRKSIIPETFAGEKEAVVKLFLCAADQINISNAWQRIREHVHQKSASREITDETVAYLDEEAEEKLIALETNLSVKLRKTFDKAGKEKISISGMKDNVLDAYAAASEIVQEYKQILTSAEYVRWQYHDNKSNTKKDFTQRESWKAEIAFRKDEKGTTQLSIKVLSTQQHCVLDFSKMEATCRELGFCEKIYRNMTSSSAEDLPSTWSDMGMFPWKLENVPPNSTEYQNILSQFTTTFNPSQYRSQQPSLQRVQNPTLYKQFIAQKGKVEARMKAAGITNIPVTQQLFHGTSADVCQKVYKDGFDRSYAGKNATMYGRGVYFAKTAQYSNGYATPDANGQRRMFLAEVVTGEYCQGNQSVITPPIKPNQTDLYDSVVDNPSSPSIFVVFKDASVYPLYVLTY